MHGIITMNREVYLQGKNALVEIKATIKINFILSYPDTESWCLVFAYIIHKATDQNNHFVPYKSTMKVMVVLPFTQIPFVQEKNIPFVF